MKEKTIKYINENIEKNKKIRGEKFCYNRVFSLFEIITQITTGIYSPKIKVDYKNSRVDTKTNECNIGYSINNENYQYYKFILDINTYEIKSIKGDCSKEIEKIVDIFHNIDIEDLLKWERICATFDSMELINNLNKNSSMFNVTIDDSAKDINKINKLFKIHENLLMSSNDIDDIMKNLEIIYSYWEIENFYIKILGFDKFLYGHFTNYDVPNIKTKKSELVIFPDSSRGSMCTNFIALNNFDELKYKNIGDTIELLYSRKYSKPKKYKILEVNYEGFYAVKNLKTNKIEFIADEYDIKNAYDALFDCNKAIYNSWYRKKYVMIT
jgi:hypothetical protein